MTPQPVPPRSISLNGERIETTAATLGGLLLDLGLSASVVATAVNGGFVARADRDGLSLINGDRVEIVSPREGG